MNGLEDMANDLNGINKKKFVIITTLLLCVNTIVFSCLFWCMSVNFPGPKGIYQSDFYDHIRAFFLVDGWYDEYSLILLVNEVLYYICSFGNLAIAIHIAILNSLTVLLTYLFMKKLFPQGNNYIILLFSQLSLFINPIYIPVLNQYMYSAGFTGSIWHSDTYIGMRFFAMLVLLFFCDRVDRYLKEFSIKEAMMFTVLLSLVNWAKPNFIIAFAPAMLVMMLLDITKSRLIGFKNWVKFGAPVLLSGLVLLPQYYNLFVSDVNSGGGENGVVFGYGLNFYYFDNPCIMLIQATAFPLLIFILNLKEIKKRKIYLVSYLTLFFSVLEYTFLGESGERSTHQNFSWGACFAFFLVFCISIVLYLKNIRSFCLAKEKNQSLRQYINQNEQATLKIFIPGLVFSIHLLCGILYFIFILLGSCGYGF